MQIVSTGLLKQTGSQDLSSAWIEGFHAAVSAVYLSLEPSMHTTINQALIDRLPSSLLNRTSSLGTPTADGSTTDQITLLAETQSRSDQVALANSESARQKHITGSGTVWHPGRIIKAAWSEGPKHNSVAPWPLTQSCNGSAQNSSRSADANQLQNGAVLGYTLAETGKALDR